MKRTGVLFAAFSFSCSVVFAQEEKHGTIKVKKETDSIVRELTPNGDGRNDTFIFNGNNIVEMKARIVDEKGNVIFETNKVGDKWDGKNKKGEKMKAGLYYYIQEAMGRDGRVYEAKGTIKLTW